MLFLCRDFAELDERIQKQKDLGKDVSYTRWREFTRLAEHFLKADAPSSLHTLFKGKETTDFAHGRCLLALLFVVASFVALQP